MPLETATTIAGLNALWPLGSDSKGQGDDHIRLIKSVLQGDPTIAAGLVAQTRNRLVNPCFQISQENGNTASTTNVYYGADQWITNKVHSAGTMATQRVQSVTPNGSRDRYRVTVTAADAALAVGEYLTIYTALEGNKIADFRYGSASARQSVLRFGWKSPAGTYSISLTNGTSNRSYVATFTVAAGAANTDTVQTFVIPGDTGGAWVTNNAVGAYLYFVMAAGATFQGVAGWQAGAVYGTSANTNGMATAGGVYELFDVGLYLDDRATGKAPAWVMPDEADELIACQRYYYAGTGVARLVWSGYATSTRTGYAASNFQTTMRIAPAATEIAGSQVGFPAGTSYNNWTVDSIVGFRTCNLTTDAGFWSSSYILNARM